MWARITNPRYLVNQLKASVNGQDSQGRTVNLTVNFDPKATISMVYTNGNDLKGVKTITANTSETKKTFAQGAAGLTNEIGNTQVNRTQVNVGTSENMAFDNNGNPIFDSPEQRASAALTGAHEDLTTAGGRHEDDPANPNRKEQMKDPNNIMNGAPVGGNFSPAQRSSMIKLIEQQQPKK